MQYNAIVSKRQRHQKLNQQKQLQRNKPLQFSPIQYNVNVVDLLWKFIEYYYITVYT